MTFHNFAPIFYYGRYGGSRVDAATSLSDENKARLNVPLVEWQMAYLSS
jgi:hypothetical protein